MRAADERVHSVVVYGFPSVWRRPQWISYLVNGEEGPPHLVRRTIAADACCPRWTYAGDCMALGGGAQPPHAPFTGTELDACACCRVLRDPGSVAGWELDGALPCGHGPLITELPERRPNRGGGENR